MSKCDFIQMATVYRMHKTSYLHLWLAAPYKCTHTAPYDCILRHLHCYIWLRPHMYTCSIWLLNSAPHSRTWYVENNQIGKLIKFFFVMQVTPSVLCISACTMALVSMDKENLLLRKYFLTHINSALCKCCICNN